MQGIRFTFAPTTAGSLLQPGFTVVPAFQVVLRGTARDGGSTSVTTATDLTNTALTTHVGSGTVETRLKMSHMAANNCIAGLTGQRPPNLLNPDTFKG